MKHALLVLLAIPSVARATDLSMSDAVNPFAVANPVTAVRIDLDMAATIDSPKVGENRLLIRVNDASGAPVKGAEITLSVAMTNMDMGTSHPKVSEVGDGRYSARVDFTMSGPWRVTAKATANGETVIRSFDFSPGGPSSGHPHETAHGAMMGKLGPWSMSREASGTSWIPDSSPMFMKMLPKSGAYELNAMGFLTFNFAQTGGKRGDQRFYSNSMLMLMARRETGGGTLGLNAMLSLDPIFNGEFGYPNLFQTGETAYGRPLVDYQHPHDLIAELSASYSRPISKGMNAFVYGGPAGEPALGGPTFMHRPSGMEIPEAPISHHWFDSTHISWGVITAGLNSDRWQLEGSVFNGHEPNENRYAPDKLALNSVSGRFTVNPNRNLSFNVSYGYLNSPESTAPGEDQHRLTAAALWSQPVRNGNNLSATAAFGRTYGHGHHSDALLIEATYLTSNTSWFTRWENVDKDELAGVPAGSYKINKFILGAVRNVTVQSGFEIGVGGYVGLYSFPSALNSYYGKRPTTLGVFIRIRPGRM